jgi:hypothetical protein
MSAATAVVTSLAEIEGWVDGSCFLALRHGLLLGLGDEKDAGGLGGTE